jgi:hypothetical protein
MVLDHYGSSSSLSLWCCRPPSASRKASAQNHIPPVSIVKIRHRSLQTIVEFLGCGSRLSPAGSSTFTNRCPESDLAKFLWSLLGSASASPERRCRFYFSHFVGVRWKLNQIPADRGRFLSLRSPEHNDSASGWIR